MEGKQFEQAIDDKEEACLSLSNHLILACKLPLPQICSLNDVDYHLFALLFQKICKMPLPDLITDPKYFEEKAHNVQVIIDTISLDLLAISLSHITGEDVVAKNVHSIQNLLEVLEGILLFNSEMEGIVCQDKALETFPTVDDKQTTTRICIGTCSSCDYNCQANTGRNNTEEGLHKEDILDGEEAEIHAPCEQCDYQLRHSSDQGERSKHFIKMEDSRPNYPLEPQIEIEHHSDHSNFNSDHIIHDFSERVLQTAAFSSTFEQKPEILRDPTIRPEFARLGLRDHTIDHAERHSFENVDPQQPSTSKISQYEAQVFEQSHSESHPSSSSIILKSSPVVCVTLNPQETKPYTLSQSVDNLTRVVPINRRRKSRSLEDIHRPSSSHLPQSLKGNSKVYNRKKTSKENLIQKSSIKAKDENIEERISADLPGSKAENVADMYGRNLEMKLKGFLEERNKHKRIATQLERTYLQAVRNKPRKSPICKKSYLLPASLRRSRTNTIRKTHHIRSSSSHKITGKKREKSIETAFLKELKEEFPGVYMSPGTVRRMKDKYQKELLTMHRNVKDAIQKKSRTQLQTEEVVKRQAILSDILRKEMEHQAYIKEENEYKQLQTRVKSSFQEARQQSARTRNYYNEFHIEMKKKMQERNYKEEVLLKNAFEERLNLQKEQVLLLRQQAKERQEQDALHHKIYLDALDNYYQTQFSMLAESLAIEKHDLQERTKAQRRVLNKMKQDFRSQMVKNVRTLQDHLVRDKEDIHFRELDAERYRERLRDNYSAHPLRKMP